MADGCRELHEDDLLGKCPHCHGSGRVRAPLLARWLLNNPSMVCRCCIGVGFVIREAFRYPAN